MPASRAASHPPPATAPSWRHHRLLALWVVLAFAALALVIGLLVPATVPSSFLEEDGPVENATIVLYLLAAAWVVLRRLPALTPVDKLALVILLLAFAAREADLHKAMFGISILKGSFYSRVGSPGQITAALGALLPIAAAVAWLAVRTWRRWPARAARWRGAIVTGVTFAVVMVVSKMFDRLPDTLLATGLLTDVPQTLRHMLQAEEEVLEAALPLLAMLGLAQLAPER